MVQQHFLVNKFFLGGKQPMQVEKPGKIPRGGGGYDKHPLEWEIQGMGSKGYEYFLELHYNLSYF